MKTHLFLGLALCVLIASGAWADDDKKENGEVQKALMKIAELGPGVSNIKRDEKGRIRSCVVVGQSRISTVLGKTKGLETARARARIAASAEFVKWIKEKVSVHAKTDDEVVLFLEGSEENDKDALRESGKAVERTGQKVESISTGLVRGLQTLYTETSDKDRTYTIVMGWDADTASATKGVKSLNESDSEERRGTEKPPSKKDKKIEDRKVASPDAGKFLK